MTGSGPSERPKSSGMKRRLRRIGTLRCCAMLPASLRCRPQTELRTAEDCNPACFLSVLAVERHDCFLLSAAQRLQHVVIASSTRLCHGNVTRHAMTPLQDGYQRYSPSHGALSRFGPAACTHQALAGAWEQRLQDAAATAAAEAAKVLYRVTCCHAGVYAALGHAVARSHVWKHWAMCMTIKQATLPYE